MSWNVGVRRTMLLATLSTALPLTILGQVWVEQGPRPIHAAQAAVPPDNPASGAVNAIVIDSTDPNTMYVAAVNGGIWKTTNGLAFEPSWTTTTDQQLPALSMSSIATSRANPEVIYAGTGTTSNLGTQNGNPGFGIAKSTDGGTTWKVLAAALGAVNNVVLSPSDPNLVLVSIGGLGAQSGVWRSTDGASTFTQISSVPGGVSGLVADPSNSNRFFAAQAQQESFAGIAGVYMTNDGGLTWTLARPPGLFGAGNSRILLAINPAGVLYAMVISVGSSTAPVFRTADQGKTWLSMGSVSNLFPVDIGPSNFVFNGAIAAHPTNNNVVFVAGAAGQGGIYRGDASQPPGNVWSPELVFSLANGTAPHVDSRFLQFDANGSLIYTCDGGVYRLIDPDDVSGKRSWQDMNGNLGVVEAYSVAYDPVARIAFAGTQDNGTPMQMSPGNPVWSDFIGGDGGLVAVDAASIPGQSIRYTTFQGLGGFNRSFWDATNTFLGENPILLNIVSGPGAGQSVYEFDSPNGNHFTAYVLNMVDPTRFMVAVTGIYESLDRGDTVANLGSTSAFISSLSYGSRLNGVDKPDVFYAGGTLNIPPFRDVIFHRAPGASAITILSNYPGQGVGRVKMDPQNYKKIYVLDVASKRVWASTDEGATWEDLTLNLATLCSDVQSNMQSLELFSPDPTSRKTALLVGCDTGVYMLRRPGAAGTTWVPLGSVPHTWVKDLKYDYSTDVLVAATLGRGVWTLTGFFQPEMVSVPSANYTRTTIERLAIPAPPPTSTPRH